MLKQVDYDERQHVGYRSARRVDGDELRKWATAFSARAPVRRPLTVLDLGSGAGRFTPALADAFGGPVFGVEPSSRMRAIAGSEAAHPGVTYLDGRAEAIPLADASCDLVLMFLSFHHVVDRAAAAAEISRVLQPDGRLLIRGAFRDRFPPVEWHRFFPRARGIELEMFPSLADVTSAFEPVGLRVSALDVIQEKFASGLADQAERLATCAISTFEHLTEAEIEAGFARLRRAAGEEIKPVPIFAPSDLLTLTN